jgi:hypothetical protein
MEKPLKTLFEFELIIIEMQSVVIDMRKRNVSKEIIDKAIERIDSLIEVYKMFDSFYFQEYYTDQKNVYLQKELQSERMRIIELQAEVEKLTKSLEWK